MGRKKKRRKLPKSLRGVEPSMVKTALYGQTEGKHAYFKKKRLGKMGAASKVRRLDPATMLPIDD